VGAKESAYFIRCFITRCYGKIDMVKNIFFEKNPSKSEGFFSKRVERAALSF
jgi:hypothetical protein